MRSALLVLSVLLLVLGGATCLPPAGDSRPLPVGTVLGVSINAPLADRSVTLGTIVQVDWAVTNETDSEASVSVSVQSRADRGKTQLTSQTISAGTTSSHSVDWDTTAFASGEYSVMVEAVSGSQRSESIGTARITIDAAPTLDFTAPTADTTLAQGGIVTIAWTAADGEGNATLTLSVDTDTDHSSGNETEILGSRAVSSGTPNDSFDWDGTDADGAPVAAGTYNVFGTIDDGVNPALTIDALAQITTPNAAPTLTFDEPTADQTISSGDMVDLAWTVTDADGDDLFVTILFDNDNSQDESAGDSTPAVELVARQADDANNRSFTWDTTDVAAGQYFLQALVEDGVNDDVFVVHTASVTITNTPPTVVFTAPAADADFLVSEPSFRFDFTVNDPDDDVLVDLKVDADDDHANGNEQTILLQRLVTKGESPEQFDWNGLTWDIMTVPNGIYTVLALVTDGTTPVTVELGALVFRRDKAADPLIALLEPARPQMVNPGDSVTIRWRDDTPTAGALVTITFDDDSQSGDINEVDKPETAILTGRDANTDGILDSFVWQVPTLTPGTYFIFAKISNPADADEHISVAQGTIIVRDPSTP